MQAYTTGSTEDPDGHSNSYFQFQSNKVIRSWNVRPWLQQMTIRTGMSVLGFHIQQTYNIQAKSGTQPNWKCLADAPF